MSVLSANSGNIKSVMRTALVGIKPADQVMLKGYLRVLLRLEADLEWVSANHPEVDLFMINNDFRQSANIIKLLQSQATKPVLYIGRPIEGLDGKIEGNLLTLPLKEMQVLNDWLFAQVGVLKSKNNEVAQRRRSAHAPVSQATQPVESNQATSSNSAAAQPTVNASKSNEPSSSTSTKPTQQSLNENKNNKNNTTSSSTTNQQANNTLLPIIQNLREGVAGKYQLSVNNEVFAIIEPLKSVVWTKKSTLGTVQASSLADWKMEKTSTVPSSLGYDLKQWLWDISKGKLQDVQPFIDAQRRYQLSYWVKPNQQDARSDLLRVMTAMETEAVTLAEIVEKSGVSTDDVSAILAGLFFAGYLNPDSYINIQVNNSGSQADLSHSNVQQEMSADLQATSMPETNIQENLSPLDAVLSKRAAGQSASSQPSSSIPSLSAASPATEPKNLDAKPEKKGFLSRLRKKLGL